MYRAKARSCPGGACRGNAIPASRSAWRCGGTPLADPRSARSSSAADTIPDQTSPAGSPPCGGRSPARCPAPQELAHPAGGVPLVPGELPGSEGFTAAVPEFREVLHQRDDVLGLVLLARADFDVQGQALALTDQVQLGAEAA